MRFNSWHQEGFGHWMCCYWDVELSTDDGRWHATFLYDRRAIPESFATAREAMAYVDDIET